MTTYEEFIRRLANLERGSCEWHQTCADWLGRPKPTETEPSDIIATVAEIK